MRAGIGCEANRLKALLLNPPGIASPMLRSVVIGVVAMIFSLCATMKVGSWETCHLCPDFDVWSVVARTGCGARARFGVRGSHE